MVVYAAKRRELKRVMYFISLFFLLILKRAKIQEKITQVFIYDRMFFSFLIYSFKLTLFFSAVLCLFNTHFHLTTNP